MDISLKINNVDKFDIPKMVKLKTRFRFNKILKLLNKDDNDDINFAGTLIIDEILEAEDGK